MSEKRSAWIDRDPVEEQPLPLADLEELEEEKLYVASYAQLMWWRFIKHRMAVISGVVFLLLYLVASLSEFIASYNPEANFLDYQLATPSRIRWVVEGRLKRPFVYGVGLTRNPDTMRRFYTENKEVKYPIRFFVEGLEYKMWGLFPANGVGQGIFILGTDQVGRDVFSRICYGARVSLTICLVSVIISLGLGIIWGGLSGYYGGMLDNAIQRLIEFIRSIPEIPLIMALAAALPIDMGIIARYFMVTMLLAFVGWTSLARVVRGRFLSSLREDDFVMAAHFSGSSEMRIILRHMLPSFMSHVIASLTLAVPGMILAETGLSFIGLGLSAPAIS